MFLTIKGGLLERICCIDSKQIAIFQVPAFQRIIAYRVLLRIYCLLQRTFF